MGDGNGERGGNGHSKATREADSEGRIEEETFGRQTDSFDSVQFELAGFGEYDSFVDRRRPCGY